METLEPHEFPPRIKFSDVNNPYWGNPTSTNRIPVFYEINGGKFKANPGSGVGRDEKNTF